MLKSLIERPALLVPELGLLLLGLVLTLLDHPRSTAGRATLVAVGWLGATYPLGGALTYLGGAYTTALPIAVAGIALALFSIRKKRVTSPSV